MTYQRIFWLDDRPDFFDSLEYLTKEAGLSLDLSALVRRTTFAFDFEMGREILERKQFDLHILDGDFPNQAPDGRRAALAAYLAKVRDGPVNYWEEYPNYKNREEDIPNNFVPFYRTCLSRLSADKKVLVFSSSNEAPVLAYLFDIPIYAKNQDGEKVPLELVRKFAARDFSRPFSRFGVHEGVEEQFLQKIGGNIGRWYNDGCPAPNLKGYEYGGMKELIERYLLPSVKHINPGKRSVK